MGKGEVMPAESRASVIRGATPSSAKVVAVRGNSVFQAPERWLLHVLITKEISWDFFTSQRYAAPVSCPLYA